MTEKIISRARLKWSLRAPSHGIRHYCTLVATLAWLTSPVILRSRLTRPLNWLTVASSVVFFLLSLHGFSEAVNQLEVMIAVVSEKSSYVHRECYFYRATHTQNRMNYWSIAGHRIRVQCICPPPRPAFRKLHRENLRQDLTITLTKGSFVCSWW